MLNGKRVIAVIPARGGSKSVPGKNIRPLAGKPLIAWSIEVARQVSEIDRIIVSTDDAQIASIGRLHGAEVYPRPPHLATDEALVIDALKHLLQTLEAEGESPEWVILLEPTCPLRTANDVRRLPQTHLPGRLRFGGNIQGCRVESAPCLAPDGWRPGSFHRGGDSMVTPAEAAESLPVKRCGLCLPCQLAWRMKRSHCWWESSAQSSCRETVLRTLTIKSISPSLNHL